MPPPAEQRGNYIPLPGGQLELTAEPLGVRKARREELQHPLGCLGVPPALRGIPQRVVARYVGGWLDVCCALNHCYLNTRRPQERTPAASQ